MATVSSLDVRRSSPVVYALTDQGVDATAETIRYIGKATNPGTRRQWKNPEYLAKMATRRQADHATLSAANKLAWARRKGVA